MKFYIANGSRQEHNFVYKLPERRQSFSYPILPGQQICLDLSKDEIDYVIKQHETYGFYPVKKLPDNFSGICFSIDKVIDTNSIIDAAEHVTNNLMEKSEQILKNSVGAIDMVMNNAAEKGGRKRKAGLEVEIEGEPVNPMQDNAPSFKQTLVMGQ